MVTVSLLGGKEKAAKEGINFSLISACVNLQYICDIFSLAYF